MGFESHQELNSERPKTEPESPAQVDPCIGKYKVDNVPSRMIPYPDGSSINWRAFTFGEVKKINSSRLDFPTLIKEVFIKGIEADGFDVWDLTIYDFIFINLMRRMATVGDGTLEVTTNCAKCGVKTVTKLTQDHMEFEDLKIEKSDYPFKVALSGDRIYEVGALTVRNLLKVIEKNLGEEDEITILAHCILNNSKSTEELAEEIYELFPEEGDALEKADLSMLHGLNPIKIKCEHLYPTGTKQLCGHITEVELESREMIISPFRTP